MLLQSTIVSSGLAPWVKLLYLSIFCHLGADDDDDSASDCHVMQNTAKKAKLFLRVPKLSVASVFYVR